MLLPVKSRFGNICPAKLSNKLWDSEVWLWDSEVLARWIVCSGRRKVKKTIFFHFNPFEGKQTTGHKLFKQSHHRPSLSINLVIKWATTLFLEKIGKDYKERSLRCNQKILNSITHQFWPSLTSSFFPLRNSIIFQP